MSRKQMIGAVVAAVLFIAVGVSSVFTNTLSQKILKKSADTLLSSGMSVSLPTTSYVGIVTVEGVIDAQTETSAFETASGYQHQDTLEYIDMMMADSNNRGILLDVDSPGGAVYEAEELYQKLMEYKKETKRPVWTYMGHYAASGGYYVAAPSDKIYANPNTTTGSIGVIISGYDLQGLYDKLGIKSYSITSGKNKDMSEMNEEQIAIYQGVVDEAYGRFVEIVAKGRGMSEDEVKGLADGRIYTAKQALANGLIDKISLYEGMTEDMQAELGNSTFYRPSYEESVLAGIFSKIEDVKPKSEAEVLSNLTEQYGSGVPMYYAEQLQ